ncbi:MAG: hypothetical protein J6U21_03945 [Bacteroidales bacterium]|nr:hypothetical protein [Bacteroidales bacterium]
MFDDLFKLTQALSVICRDNGRWFTVADRLDVVAQKLARTDYQIVDNRGLYRLYGKRPLDEIHLPLIVVSSHIDCVDEITRCFSKLEGNDCIKGTYDNLITNAVAVYLMQNGGLPDNVLFAFTGDEEYGSNGANDLSKALRPYQVEVIIVVDVTYLGWQDGAMFTVENDFMSDELKKTIIRTVNESTDTWRYLPAFLDFIAADVPEENIVRQDAFVDEAWMYDDYDYNCFSFCLPVLGEMHCDDGVLVRKESLTKYTEMLRKIVFFQNKR